MNFVQHYWWIGLAFSVVYTLGSVWWTINAERRLRWLREEISNCHRVIYNEVSSNVSLIGRIQEKNNERFKRIEIREGLDR